MKEGHLIIFICVLFYAFATHFYREKKYLLGVIFILGAVATIRIYMGSHLFFMPWDERFHALVAKSMVENPFKPLLYKTPILDYDYTDWSSNHIWVHKQPMGLWLIALSYNIFGFNEWAVRFPSLLMSLITVFLIYRIGQKLFSPKVGWLSALCFSIVALPITTSAGITCAEHVDIPFMCMITAGIYFGILAVQKSNLGRFALAGFFMGGAILSKWLPGLIVLGVVSTYAMYDGKISFGKTCLNLLTMTVVGAAVFLPWQLYIFKAFPREAAYEANYNMRHFYQALEGHNGSPWYHVDVTVQQWSVAFYALIPLFLLLGFRNKKQLATVTLATWIFIPLIFFSVAKTKMEVYCLFIYPAIAIAFAYTIDQLISIQSKFRSLIWIPILVFFGMTIIGSIDNMHLNTHHLREEQWSRTIKDMGKAKRDKPLVVFNTMHYIECMYYIENCTAYDFMVDSTIVDSLKDHGYDILIYNDLKNTYEGP